MKESSHQTRQVYQHKGCKRSKFFSISKLRVKARQSRGAALVEMAFALMLLMLCGVIFWETVSVMLSHQRTTYAAYVGERARIVGGDAVAAAQEVGGRVVEPGPGGTRVWETLDLELGNL